MNSGSDPVKFAYEDGKKSFETFSVWEDAGFIPAKEYVYLVELLHLSFLNGNFIMTGLINEISEKNTLFARHYQGSLSIFDSAKMYRLANDMKIEVAKKDDAYIAGLIIAGIIADYLPICYFNDFFGKNSDSLQDCQKCIS